MIMAAAVAAADESLEEVNLRLQQAGLADGLPVMPPTLARIRACYEGAHLDPVRIVGKLEPALQPATVYDIAVNAVMAGCEAAHLAVLVAAVSAAAEPRLNLLGLQTTTGSAAVAILINGPIRERLQIAGGSDCLSGSRPANARIGRALRLILQNLGGARPGELDPATMGQPAKTGLCFAENEAGSPWPPLHVERGHRPEESTVTLFGISGSSEVVAASNGGAAEILQTIAQSMTVAGNVGSQGLVGGGEPFIVLSPEHAATLAAEDYDKAGVKRELWRRARLRLRDLAQATRLQLELQWREAGAPEPAGGLPVAARSGDITIVVAGGAGLKSTYLPGWSGGTRSVTRVID